MSDTSAYDGRGPIGAYSSLQTQITYSWINNEHFYRLVPQAYQDYYQRFVKQWLYWYDGFVPHFHNTASGMVSTRLAYAIINKLAEKTVGNKLLFNDDGFEDKHSIKIRNKDMGSVEFSEYWGKKHKLTSSVKQAFEWAFAGGDSVLKLDSDGKDVILSVMRKDQYLIDTNFRGEIVKFQGFVYAYNKMIQGKDSGDDKRLYYVVEEREYVNDVPMYRVGIKVSHGQTTQGRSYDNQIEDMPFDRLPKDIVRKFKKDFPNVVIGEWYEIPFKNLGIHVIKASNSVSFLPDAPFGESLLSPLIHILMTYDFYFSSLTTNLYVARDKVILPQHMTSPELSDPDNFYAQPQNWNRGLDSFMFVRVPYTDPESQKPIFIQPEIRDWKQVRDLLLQSAAMILGVDERTIASAIVPNAEKPTAREISVDEDTTASFVNDKRVLNENSLNELIDNVLYFYGFDEECVTVGFSRAGLSNLNNVVTVASILKQNGLGDTKSLLEMVWVDKNDVQIEEMLQRIEEEQQRLMEQQQVNSDVEEGIERQNDNTEYHIKKEKGEG